MASIEALAERKALALRDLDEAIAKLNLVGLDISGRPALKRNSRDKLAPKWNLCLILEHSTRILERCLVLLSNQENELVSLRSQLARLQAEKSAK